MSNKQQIKDILESIEDLFGDTSVDMEVTKDALEEIRDECESKIEALKEDIKSKRG